MEFKPNILVVCGKNKRRSRTAEHIFKNDSRFKIRSVGLSPKSERKISEKDITWADLVFVMERSHQHNVFDLYNYLRLPKIEVLDIPDEYEYLDEELILILTGRMNDILRSTYNI